MTRSKARRIGTMNASSDADSAPEGPASGGSRSPTVPEPFQASAAAR
jgi:hypothetical protein